MSSVIQEQLKLRMESKSLSPASLEKKAGLKRGVIGNILRGSSKSPTSDTLVAIANILGCSIDDLLNRETTKHPPLFSLEQNISSPPSQTPWCSDLYLKTVSNIVATLKNKNLEISAEKATILIKEIYHYSLSKNKDDVDKDFSEWLINKL